MIIISNNNKQTKIQLLLLSPHHTESDIIRYLSTYTYHAQQITSSCFVLLFLLKGSEQQKKQTIGSYRSENTGHINIQF